MGHTGVTCYSRLHLEGADGCYNVIPTLRVEKVCRALLTHYLIPSSVNKKLFGSHRHADSEIPKENNPRSVYIAHVRTFSVFFFFFLNGGEIFWSWFWMPQRWRMFLLISIVIVKSIRKGWYTEKKIHQIFLHRVWMLFLFYFLSCIAVYLPAWRIWTHSTSFTRAFFALNFVGVKAIMLYSDVSHECLAESAPAARHSQWSPNRLHPKHTPVEGLSISTDGNV